MRRDYLSTIEGRSQIRLLEGPRSVFLLVSFYKHLNKLLLLHKQEELLEDSKVKNSTAKLKDEAKEEGSSKAKGKRGKKGRGE